MTRFRKLLITKTIGLVIIVTFSVTTTVYGIDLSDFEHLRKPLDFSDVSLDADKRHSDARKDLVATEENLRLIDENERNDILQAIKISIEGVRIAKRLKLISRKQKNENISLLRELKRKNSIFIRSNPEKILNIDYFLGPIRSNERFIFAQELFNRSWFKGRGLEYLSDLILFRTLSTDDLRNKIIGEEKVIKLKQTVEFYLENYRKSPQERNLTLLYFEESLEDIRPRVTEAIKEVIDQLFYQESEERNKLIQSLETLNIFRSRKGNWLSTSHYYWVLFKALFLGHSVKKDVVHHEMGHHSRYLFNLEDPFSVFGNIVRGLLGKEDENVQKGKDYARSYLEQKVTQGELKKTISEKWLEGRTKKYRDPKDFFSDEDYKAGYFLAGLFLGLHGNDKKRAMKFALDLTFAEWFNWTRKFLKKYYFLNNLYLALGLVGDILFVISGGWGIYILTESAWAVVGGVIAIIVLGAFLMTGHESYREKLFNERVERGDVKDFGAPIADIDLIDEEAPQHKTDDADAANNLTSELIKFRKLQADDL
ncbi:MAG: hypothetical protein P9L93_04770 [Candidatus Gorgyraea atricola]|nr:hypothetical protein [Candidatus Gorgyraea atricola]